MNAINTWYRRNYNGILGVGAAVFGVLKAVVIILLTAASLGIAFTIFLSAKTLGLWWIPLEIGFIALLMFVALIPEHRRATKVFLNCILRKKSVRKILSAD